MQWPDMGWGDLVVGVFSAIVGWLAKVVHNLTKSNGG